MNRLIKTSIQTAPMQAFTSDKAGILQRQCACGNHTVAGGECEECRKNSDGTLQCAGVSAALVSEVPPIVHEVLRSKGEPIDVATRAFIEPRFGHDFSHVRIHTDTKAAESAKAVNALAYTVGRDVVFGAGQYALSTGFGHSLLTHELAHVVQQAHSIIEPTNELRIGMPNSTEEQQAEGMASAAAHWQRMPQVNSVQRQVMRATRTFALTFDDGPHAAELGKGINRTEKVLDTLKAKGIKAGFFIQTSAKDREGKAMRGSTSIGRKLMARMHAEGHKVGIHTGGPSDHELHTIAQKEGRLRSELESAKESIKTATGVDTTLVRPPTGAFNKDVLETYARVSLTNLLWDIDGDNGRNFPLKTLKKRIESGMEIIQKRGWKSSTSSPQIVVLYHDIQKSTAENLDTLIEHIKITTKTISNGIDAAAFAAP